MNVELVALKLEVNKFRKQCGNYDADIKTDLELIEVLKKDKQILRFALLLFKTMDSYSYKELIISLLKCCKNLKKNLDFAYEVLSYDIDLISLFPLLKNRQKIKLLTLSHMPELFKKYTDWHNEKKALVAVRFNPVVYRYLPEELKYNREIIKSALSYSIVYSQNNNDKIDGMYFDLPEKIRKEKSIVLLALKNHPSLYKSLDIIHKEDSDIILTALRKGFYENNISEFYSLQSIIPYIPNKFYSDINNVKWIMIGFENNLEEAKFYTDCAMLIFCHFMRESSQVYDELKDFFDKTDITRSFEEILKKHNFKIYSEDQIPSGIEIEADLFFNKNFPFLSVKFEKFLLQKKLQDTLKLNFAVIDKKGKL